MAAAATRLPSSLKCPLTRWYSCASLPRLLTKLAGEITAADAVIGEEPVRSRGRRSTSTGLGAGHVPAGDVPVHLFLRREDDDHELGPHVGSRLAHVEQGRAHQRPSGMSVRPPDDLHPPVVEAEHQIEVPLAMPMDFAPARPQARHQQAVQGRVLLEPAGGGMSSARALQPRGEVVGAAAGPLVEVDVVGQVVGEDTDQDQRGAQGRPVTFEEPGLRQRRVAADAEGRDGYAAGLGQAAHPAAFRRHVLAEGERVADGDGAEGGPRADVAEPYLAEAMARRARRDGSDLGRDLQLDFGAQLEAKVRVGRGQLSPLGAARMEGLDRAERSRHQRPRQDGQDHLDRHQGEDDGEQEEADSGATGPSLRPGCGPLRTVSGLQQGGPSDHGAGGAGFNRPGYS